MKITNIDLCKSTDFSFIRNRLASPSKIVENTQKIALPLIALIGFELLPKVDAGPAHYVLCVGVCSYVSWAQFPLCFLECAPLLKS